MKKFLTAILTASLFASPVITQAKVVPTSPCITVEVATDSAKRVAPTASIGLIENEELKKFMVKFNELAVGYATAHGMEPVLIDASIVLVVKDAAEDAVSYGVYDKQGCLAYEEVVSTSLWEKFMDAVFGGVEG
jgi:hypothetical protein